MDIFKRQYRYRRHSRKINAAIAVTAVASIIALTALIIQAYETRTAFVFTGNISRIIIDPGHGGIDGGAQSANGLLEKDVNLDIALKLRDLLTVSGYETVMTRTTDISIHDSNASTIAKQKTSDLKNRLKIINSGENSIAVSIHQNYFEQSQYSGAQMFYGGKNTYSELLAQTIQENFVNYLQPNNTRQIKKAGSNLYLMKNAKIPAVLVECGFLSNEDEASLLSGDEYRSKVAFAIYCGILDFKNRINSQKETEN